MRALFWAFLLALVAGCHSSHSDDIVNLSKHLQRYDELRRMEPGACRDEEFARLTEDACADGFPDLAHIAISHVEADHLRDTIAFECAFTFQRCNASLEATRMARLIRDPEELRMAIKDIHKSRLK